MTRVAEGDGRDIRPVLERLRVLGPLDLGLPWGNLGVSLLVIASAAAALSGQLVGGLAVASLSRRALRGTAGA